MISKAGDVVRYLHKEDEYTRYMGNGAESDFINDDDIRKRLKANREPKPHNVRPIIEKSLAIETLQPDETAALLNVKEKELWKEIFEAAGSIKKKVYDN
ncbi:MAG: hypothetical protein KAU14_06425, partial [Thermoplasmata archaeon]|nr:hypothetical protein [Thermoplasmata archaeon]